MIGQIAQNQLEQYNYTFPATTVVCAKLERDTSWRSISSCRIGIHCTLNLTKITGSLQPSMNNFLLEGPQHLSIDLSPSSQGSKTWMVGSCMRCHHPWSYWWPQRCMPYVIIDIILTYNFSYMLPFVSGAWAFISPPNSLQTYFLMFIMDISVPWIMFCTCALLPSMSWWQTFTFWQGACLNVLLITTNLSLQCGHTGCRRLQGISNCWVRCQWTQGLNVQHWAICPYCMWYFTSLTHSTDLSISKRTASPYTLIPTCQVFTSVSYHIMVLGT